MIYCQADQLEIYPVFGKQFDVAKTVQLVYPKNTENNVPV
jgi:hypothetical protein